MLKIDFTPDALKDISSLDKSISHRVVEKLDWLIKNFDSVTPEMLSGEYRGKYKLRVGDWRIVYSIEYEKETITIYTIEHRSKVYKT
jgi:mRNA interferase RelE/StbE